MISNFKSGFFDLVVGRPAWTIVISFLVIAVLTAGVQQLITVNVDLRNHFNDDDPHLIKLEHFEDLYALSDGVLVVAAPSNNTIFTRDTLVAVENLTEALWQTPYSTRVDSITNYSHIEGQEDTLIVEPLVDDAKFLDNRKIEQIRSIALTTQETAGRFISRDGRLAGLTISLVLPDKEREQAKNEVVDAFYDLVNKQRAAHPDIEYHIYGELLLDRAVREALTDDMSILAPIALAMMVLVAVFLLRSAWAVCGIFIMIIGVLASSFGLSGWVGLKIYAESGAALFVLMAIAVAHSVHLIQGMTTGRLSGMERTASIIYSLQANARPIFFTSITTAIGFLSLNFSEMPPFRIMGNVVALGAMLAFVYSVTLLPALLSVMPIRVSSKQSIGVQFFDRLATFVVSKSTLLLWAFAILSLVSVVGVLRIELNDNNIKLLNESYELRRSADFINDNFSGLDNFEYSLNSGREGGITDIEYLHKVDSFANWLRQQPEVSHVTSIADVMKRLNQSLHADADGTYTLPDNSGLAAQYLFLYELSLPVGLDLNNFITFDRSATRATVVVKGMSVKEQIELDNRAVAWLQRNAPQMQTGATGVVVVSAYSVQRNIEKMLLGTFIAMSIVSLLLIFEFRSLRLGLLSLVPNFLPAIAAMGVWGYAAGTVSIAASLVTAIAFGIVVDDTIHLLSKYQKSRAEGKSAAEAIAPTFGLVGRPLLTTTLIFALGFLVFGVSGLSTNQTLGLLVGLMVIIAVVADFLLFPPLLMVLDKEKRR